MSEEDKLKVSEELVEQYIRTETVVKEFTAYYDLFNKYKNDYMVYELLDRAVDEDTVNKAKQAAVDERVSLLGMLLDICLNDVKEVMDKSDILTGLMPVLKTLKESENVYDILSEQLNKRKDIYNKRIKANSLDMNEKQKLRGTIAFLENLLSGLDKNSIREKDDDFNYIKNEFDSEVETMKKMSEKTNIRLHNLFDFTDRAFSDGNEMILLLTELTAGKLSSKYISMFGCPDYERYNSKLMLSERSSIIKKEIDGLLEI